ncbi:DNA repair protein Rev1 isoform X1 [Drosophila bipectinata]|uniref:DNA repair protein Rev1 isoform X1 n=1 Tax=Drosophila bipectinata TaxID=42026 RepID=UPI001C8A4CC8|nr:DNA repair protein Rev1 [Drosophila bipectinata]
MARDEDNGFGDWGGYFEAKKSKLEEQFSAASDPFRKTNLFAGISIFVNGRTNPSADELKRIMMVHGGTYHHYERSHTTFTIATNVPDVKVRNMNLSKFISAQWVVDCLENEKILDYKPYLLYTNQKTSQPRLNFGKSKNDSNNESKLGEPPLEKTESNLDGILKELQQAVAASPEKEAKITNLSTTSNTSHNAMTAVDPGFLSEFYKNSRLHHIATLGAGFKQYVCELRQAQGSKGFPKRQDLKSLLKSTKVGSMRYVMHIDMDCFFVSVGLRSHPELRGLPVAVTHSKGGSSATDVPVHPQADRQAELELFAQRFEHHLHDNIKADKVRSGFDKKMSLSEIASCSYEARKKGIRNGMFVGQALKMCPDLKTIPYDFEGYKEVAFTLYNTVAQYTLNIEAVSCDEMFVELTDLVDDLKVDVMAFVGHLRQEVHTKTGCPCSAGVGSNKLLARMATKEAKPNGQYLLDHDQDLLAYMAPTPLESLPGVGSSMSYKLGQVGLSSCGDVQKITLEKLESVLGKKQAQTLYQNCQGIDTRPLNYEQQRKQVSAEANYGIRFTKTIEVENFLRQLGAEVTTRLIDAKRRTKSINLKIMVRAAEAPVETSKFMGHGVCDVINKSSVLKHSTEDVNVITSHVLNMMREAHLPPNELRGIGIHLSKLEDVNVVRKENVLKNMFVKISEKKKDQTIVEPQEVPAKETKPIPEETKVKPKGKKSVLSMLTAAAGRKSLNEDRVRKESSRNYDFFKGDETGPAFSTEGQFDPEVLAQLPDDIRREVLAFKEQHLRPFAETEETGRSPSKKSKRGNRTPSPAQTPAFSPACGQSPLNEIDLQPSTSKAAIARLEMRASRKEDEFRCRSDQIVSDYIDELPKYNHPAILDYISRPVEEVPCIEVRNFLLQADYKNLLNDWVTNEEVPAPADVDLMHGQIYNLVKADKMAQIYEVMKHLCRLINSKRSTSCPWHMAYNHIESDIQKRMIEVQGYNMYFTETIRCYKCVG